MNKESATWSTPRTLAAGLSALLLVAVLLVEGRSLARFHSLAPWSSPQRINYCGRDYDLAGSVTATEAEHDGEASPFKRLTHGPLWQPIYGHPANAQQRRVLGVPCAMELFMRDGKDYLSYELVGGP